MPAAVVPSNAPSAGRMPMAMEPVRGTRPGRRRSRSAGKLAVQELDGLVVGQRSVGLVVERRLGIGGHDPAGVGHQDDGLAAGSDEQHVEVVGAVMDELDRDVEIEDETGLVDHDLRRVRRDGP